MQIEPEMHFSVKRVLICNIQKILQSLIFHQRVIASINVLKNLAILKNNTQLML